MRQKPHLPSHEARSAIDTALRYAAKNLANPTSMKAALSLAVNMAMRQLGKGNPAL
jgi:4-hydroxy-L-threonine phosphate dehydrogenase PdxA